MVKDELKEAEEEVLRVLQKDKEFSKQVKSESKRIGVQKPKTVLGGTAIGYPVIVGIASLGGGLLIRQLTAMSILPLVAFSFFCTFLPGLIAGISDRFFQERVINPIYPAGVLGFGMMIVAFVLIYTLPITSLPDELQDKTYPFGTTEQSMLSLDMPMTVLGRIINGSIIAVLGTGILSGMLFSKISSKKEV